MCEKRFTAGRVVTLRRPAVAMGWSNFASRSDWCPSGSGHVMLGNQRAAAAGFAALIREACVRGRLEPLAFILDGYPEPWLSV